MPTSPQPLDSSQGLVPDAKPSFLRRLGPGLITGAADDDPSGIATYSQAGAQFGLGTLWSLCFTYPLMVGIQLVSARIGRVTGHGLAANMRMHYPRALLWAVVVLLLVANVINLAADLSAMGDAAVLVFGGEAKVFTIGFGLLTLVLQVMVPYTRYVRVLKWLTLVLFSYVAVLFTIEIPWREVLRAVVVPPLQMKAAYLTTVVAIFGTTISPYLFFWQASQEVEEMRSDAKAKPLLEAPEQAPANFRRMKADTFFGMGVSNLIAFFVVLTAALALNAKGMTDIQTSAQAAAALKPIAGQLAFWLFALGIIGTGMLAIPVLAGSAAYALAGTFDWNASLEDKPTRSRGFYAVIVVSTLLGIVLGFTPLDPIKALFWSAVLNGVIAVPVMVVMMLMVSNRRLMGDFTASRRLQFLGWAATAAMAVVVGAMFMV
jgi:NRAMP (natural resistance-associated macrophage protein)-like metal ion transporter